MTVQAGGGLFTVVKVKTAGSPHLDKKEFVLWKIVLTQHEKQSLRGEGAS